MGELTSFCKPEYYTLDQQQSYLQLQSLRVGVVYHLNIVDTPSCSETHSLYILTQHSGLSGAVHPDPTSSH